MSFLGAGFAIGAATALTRKLKDKREKEEARFAFIKEAVDQGLSEFETQAGTTKASIEQLYKRAEDHVISTGLHQDLNKLSKDELDILNSELGTQGINLYVKNPNDPKGDNILNPKLYDAGTVGDNNKAAVIKGLSKISLKKLLEAQKNPNFDVNNASHVGAILDARVGLKGRFKAAATRNVLADGTPSEYTNREVISTGFSPENYVSQPVEKISLFKRISNALTPMDQKAAIAQYAKDNNLSIAQTERLFRAGQTEAMDAFTGGKTSEDIEGLAGSIYGDLPDLTLRNLQTLMPSDKTVKEQEAYVISLITNNQIKDAVYKNPDQEAISGNINYDDQNNQFIGKDGNLISEEDFMNIYSTYDAKSNKLVSASAERSILSRLKEFDPNTDIRHRNDPDNMTDYYKDLAVIFEVARGSDTTTNAKILEGISSRLQDAGLPSLDVLQKSGDVNLFADGFLRGNQFMYHPDDKTFGPLGSTSTERITGQQLFREIIQDLMVDQTPSEDILPMAHAIMVEIMKADTNRAD